MRAPYPAMNYLLSESAHHFSLPSMKVEKKTFADGEVYIRILDDVKNKDVTIISNILASNILELLLLVDAVRRAEGTVVRIIIPYLGYARQDKVFLPGEAVSGAVICSLLRQLNIPVIAYDVHSSELFQYLPFDHKSVLPCLAKQLPKKKYVVISPDKGGVERARMVATLLNAPMQVMEKQRKGYSVSITFTGNVRGATVLLIDDMISGGATLIEAAKAALSHGAKEVIAIAAHGLFLGDARKKLEESGISKIIVANTLPVKAGGKIGVVDVSKELS
ncbi:ribose-phosphate pyrophosphokinase [Candidatus Woesearchaeota archaeon]|nr:ribose-phosphate pyrophosphokinase [Candidatus Woesearchaeota archaeon]